MLLQHGHTHVLQIVIIKMHEHMLYIWSSLRCMDIFMLYKLSSLRCRYVVTPNKLSSLKDCVCAIVANTSLTPCFQNRQSGSCTPPARCGQVWSDAGRMKFTCRPCCTASGNCPCSRWPAMPPGSTRSTTTRWAGGQGPNPQKVQNNADVVL